MEMNAGEKVLHELENELHIDIVPGTEVMTDVGSYHFVKSSSRVLVPQPSDDPHDPLNWSLKWKTMCIIASTMVSFTQGFGPLALAPMFPYYMKDFNASLEAVIDFTGVVILVLGFSNFIWVPISTSCGRRPVLIFSQLICFASSIWRAKATSYASFMGATVLNGIGAGPSETIQPAVIADIFFLHDRGCWNTVYWVAYMGSLMVGPIISGSMSLHVGWRSFWWLNTGLVGLSILMIVFMFPETKYHRAHPNEIIDSVPSQENVNTDRDSGSGLEKKDASAVHVARRAADSKQPQSSNALSHQLTADRDPWLGKGSPSWSQWGIYAPSPNPLRAILLDFWVPWKLFAFPIVEFSSFVVSWSCSCFLTINLTQSQNFAAPPYNFNSENIGFMNFAILIGAFIGLGTAGPLSDWVSARATKKNRGIREPEQRLPSMIPYVIVMIIGNFVVAYGYENKWHWATIVVVGYACAGIQVAALPAMATTYAVDSYKPVSGSLMVSITVNKNLWGYGFSKFLTPWIVQSGYVPPIMTNMSLTTLWCLFGIVFYFFGKQFRRWSKNSSVHRL